MEHSFVMRLCGVALPIVPIGYDPAASSDALPGAALLVASAATVASDAQLWHAIE